VSIDLFKTPYMKRRDGSIYKSPGVWHQVPGRVQGKAQALPLADNSIDFIFSNGAPPTLARTESAFTRQISELERVLTEEGSARVRAPYLKFLDLEHQANSGPLSLDKLREISTQYLLDHGHNVELEISQEPDGSNSYYWIIRKPEKKEEEPQS
jgi:ubiquinone/menaquinone biosynthesis C-methylase UbiE